MNPADAFRKVQVSSNTNSPGNFIDRATLLEVHMSSFLRATAVSLYVSLREDHSALIWCL
jgi:hypothetical protein